LHPDYAHIERPVNVASECDERLYLAALSVVALDDIEVRVVRDLCRYPERMSIHEEVLRQRGSQ